MSRAGMCNACENEYSDITVHRYRNPNHKPKTWNECPSCGERYDYMGNHWNSSTTCDYPELTKRQYDIVTGSVMGDGSIDRQYRENPRLVVGSITEEYLDYLDDIFGLMGRGVKLYRTAEESVNDVVSRGFHGGATVENYSDVYVWKTRASPEFIEFADWYDSGEKVWPPDIELTPTVLKHWYCGDGCYQQKSHISIALSNERGNEGKVTKYFTDVGLPAPRNWSERYTKDFWQCHAVWGVDGSHELWDYMLSDGHGIPPGFEYKWPEVSR